MAKVTLSEHMKARWLQAYTDKIHLPYSDSIETENAKARVIMDPGRCEAQKWYDLAKLCLNSKETFYVPTMTGCYSFEYYNRNGDEYCKIRYGIATFDKDILNLEDTKVYNRLMSELNLYEGELLNNLKHSNQNVYRFGLNTHMEPPIIKMQSDGQLSMSPETIRDEYRDFAPEPIVTTKLTDIPYNSLVCWGNYDNTDGVMSVKEMTDIFHGFEFTERQQQFIENCTGFYATSPHYNTAMALKHKMEALAQFQVMRNNYNAIQTLQVKQGLSKKEAYKEAKNILWYKYIAPDELCVKSDEEFFIDKWMKRELGIEDMSSATPESEAFLGLDEDSERRYIQDAVFVDKAIQEFFYQKWHDYKYPEYEKPPESKFWYDRTVNMWTNENIQDMKEKTSIALGERVEQQKNAVQTRKPKGLFIGQDRQETKQNKPKKKNVLDIFR